MRDYLLFRLHGALASWGDIAVGDIRPSYRYPSKSAVVGLIAAALGVERDDHNKQSEIAKLNFSVRIDRAGVPIDDYHTVQAPSEQAIKHDRDKNYWTRTDEIEAIKFRVSMTESSAEAGAIQSRRTYYCDAIYAVALAENENNKVDWHALELTELKDIVAFLTEPRFTLYLGRKSCPPCLPFEPQIIEAARNCIEAFQRAEFKFADELELILKQDTVQYYTEEMPEKAIMKLMKRDQPVNRTAWQFTERDEYYFRE
jgi:CRISPR system Cascade subunit CasD